VLPSDVGRPMENERIRLDLRKDFPAQAHRHGPQISVRGGGGGEGVRMLVDSSGSLVVMGFNLNRPQRFVGFEQAQWNRCCILIISNMGMFYKT